MATKEQANTILNLHNKRSHTQSILSFVEEQTAATCDIIVDGRRRTDRIKSSITDTQFVSILEAIKIALQLQIEQLDKEINSYIISKAL